MMKTRPLGRAEDNANNSTNQVTRKLFSQVLSIPSWVGPFNGGSGGSSNLNKLEERACDAMELDPLADRQTNKLKTLPSHPLRS